MAVNTSRKVSPARESKRRGEKKGLILEPLKKENSAKRREEGGEFKRNLNST